MFQILMDLIGFVDKAIKNISGTRPDSLDCLRPASSLPAGFFCEKLKAESSTLKAKPIKSKPNQPQTRRRLKTKLWCGKPHTDAHG